MTSSEITEEIFHCVRCDKELRLNDYFFDVYLEPTKAKKYGVHAACLKAHDDLIGPFGENK